jgi:hypothetical protein
MTAFEDLIADRRRAKRFLAEIVAWDPVASAAVTLYFADDKFVTAPTDTPANTPYLVRIATGLTFSRTLFREPEAGQPIHFGGASLPDWGDLYLANGDGALDDLIDYVFDGRPVSILMGGDGFDYDDFAAVYSGTCAGVDFQSTRVVVKLRDFQERLNKAIQETVYAGTGGAEGDGNIEGQPKPLCFGECYHVVPKYIDTANLVFQVHARQVSAINAVYAGGKALTATSDHASYAALTGATIAAGSYGTCLAEGMFRLGAAPTLGITADVKGDAVGGYVDTVAGMARRIAVDFGGFADPGDLDTTSFADLDTATSSAKAGMFVAGTQTIIQVLDALFPAAGRGWWGCNRDGDFQVGRLEAPAATAALDLDGADATELSVRKTTPVWKVTVRYKPIGTTLSGAMLDATVTEATKSYLAEQYRSVTAEDADVKDDYDLAPELTVTTTLVAVADAQAVADHLLDLHGVSRTVAVGTFAAQPLAVHLHDTAALTDTRFGLSAGQNFRVIQLAERLGDPKVSVTLWG